MSGDVGVRKAFGQRQGKRQREEHMKCRLCGNETKILTDQLRRGKGVVYFCDRCQYGMLEPVFEDAADYYDKEYRKAFKDILSEEKETAKEIFDIRSKYQKDRLDVISQYYDVNRNFLEIGSSAGQFLWHVKDKFGELAGIELDTSCAAFCRELLASGGVKTTIYTDSMEDIRWKPEETFDYIAFFQVLEHITDPVQFMRNVRERLKDDGRVFIEVPNLDDPLRSLWDVPEYEKFYYHEAHLSYFSEKSLGLLLETCGFSAEKFYFQQDYNLLNNLYWHFNHAPQNTCEFGLDKPHIAFKNKAAGAEMNRLFEQMNERYFQILAKYRMTSNLFVVAKKMAVGSRSEGNKK